MALGQGDVCCEGRRQGAAGQGSFLEEVASAEGLWSFLFPFKKKKKNAFLLYKDSIQVVLKRTKQRARVTLLQSGHCQYCKRFQIALCPHSQESGLTPTQMACGEPGFSERTRGSLGRLFCREPMAVGVGSQEGSVGCQDLRRAHCSQVVGTGARPRRPSVPPQRHRILFSWQPELLRSFEHGMVTLPSRPVWQQRGVGAGVVPGIGGEKAWTEVVGVEAERTGRVEEKLADLGIPFLSGGCPDLPSTAAVGPH